MSKVAQIKLSKTAENPRLAKIDELIFAITPADTSANRYNQIDITASSRGDVELSIIGDGYFTDAGRANDFGTTKTIVAGTTESVYLSDGTFILSIMNKSNVSRLVINSSPEVSCKNIACNMAQFRDMSDLTDLQLVGTDASGDATRALGGNSALTSLGLANTNVYGNMAELKDKIAGLDDISFPVAEDAADALVFDVQAADDNAFFVSADGGNVILTLSDGFFFTDENGEANSGTSKTIINGNESDVYIKGTGAGTLSITGYEFISKLLIENKMSTVAFDLSQLANMPNLKEFTFYGNWDVYGDIAGLRKSTRLEKLDINSVCASGDISVFRDMTALTYLDISKTGIGGDIRHFANLTNLRTLILSNSGAHGTCLSLRKLTNLRRLDIDAVSVYGGAFWQSTFNNECYVNGTSAGSLVEDPALDAYLATMLDAAGNELMYFDNEANAHINGNIYAANIVGLADPEEDTMSSIIDANGETLVRLDSKGNIYVSGNVYCMNGPEVVKPLGLTYLAVMRDKDGNELVALDGDGNMWFSGNLHAANYGTIVPETEPKPGEGDEAEPDLYPKYMSIMVDDEGHDFAHFDSEGNLYIHGNVYAKNTNFEEGGSQNALATLLDADDNTIAFWDEYGNLHLSGNISGANYGDWTYYGEDTHLSMVVDNVGETLMYFDKFGDLHVAGNIYAANI